MADTTESKVDEEQGGIAQKASDQLQKMVGRVVDTGIGPLTGSIQWAEDRLARVQGERYVPNSDQLGRQGWMSKRT
jgi:hypothetical protein